jgi:hypothetical protein
MNHAREALKSARRDEQLLNLERALNLIRTARAPENKLRALQEAQRQARDFLTLRRCSSSAVPKGYPLSGQQAQLGVQTPRRKLYEESEVEDLSSPLSPTSLYIESSVLSPSRHGYSLISLEESIPSAYTSPDFSPIPLYQARQSQASLSISSYHPGHVNSPGHSPSAEHPSTFFLDNSPIGLQYTPPPSLHPVVSSSNTECSSRIHDPTSTTTLTSVFTANKLLNEEHRRPTTPWDGKWYGIPISPKANMASGKAAEVLGIAPSKFRPKGPTALPSVDPVCKSGKKGKESKYFPCIVM